MCKHCFILTFNCSPLSAFKYENVVKLRNKFHYVHKASTFKYFKWLNWERVLANNTQKKKYWMFNFSIWEILHAFNYVNVLKCPVPLARIPKIWIICWMDALKCLHSTRSTTNNVAECRTTNTEKDEERERERVREARRKRSNNVTITWFALIIYAWSRHGSSRVLKSICSFWSCRRRRRRRRSLFLLLLLFFYSSAWSVVVLQIFVHFFPLLFNRLSALQLVRQQRTHAN